MQAEELLHLQRVSTRNSTSSCNENGLDTVTTKLMNLIDIADQTKINAMEKLNLFSQLLFPLCHPFPKHKLRKLKIKIAQKIPIFSYAFFSFSRQ